MDATAEDLYQMYQGEVLGEIAFAVACGYSDDPVKRDKLLMLRKLETRTKAQIEDWLRARDIFLKPKTDYREAVDLGIRYGIDDWRLNMQRLLAATVQYMPLYQRLLANAEVVDRHLFEKVIAHEEALAEFARGELVGQKDAIEPVRRLLQLPL